MTKRINKPSKEVIEKLELLDVWEMEYLDDEVNWLTEPINDNGQPFMPPKLQRRTTFIKAKLEATPALKNKTFKIDDSALKSGIPRAFIDFDETFNKSSSCWNTAFFADETIQAPIITRTVSKRNSIAFNIGDFKPRVASTPMTSSLAKKQDPLGEVKKIDHRKSSVVFKLNGSPFSLVNITTEKTKNSQRSPESPVSSGVSNLITEKPKSRSSLQSKACKRMIPHPKTRVTGPTKM